MMYVQRCCYFIYKREIFSSCRVASNEKEKKKLLIILQAKTTKYFIIFFFDVSCVRGVKKCYSHMGSDGPDVYVCFVEHKVYIKFYTSCYILDV